VSKVQFLHAFRVVYMLLDVVISFCYCCWRIHSRLLGRPATAFALTVRVWACLFNVRVDILLAGYAA
jgi:hypothetical protein